MTIKAILFDLDNTLINFTKFKEQATKAAAKAMIAAGLKMRYSELSKQLLEFYYSHGIESNDSFEAFLKKEFDFVDYRILAAGVNAYIKEKYLCLKPYSGAIKTLRTLKGRGFKLGVVSDGLKLKAWMRLNETGLDEYFNVVITFEDTGKNKPEPEPFVKAARELNVKPEECLFVGDWIEKDIEGAKRVGMRTCFAKYGYIGKKIESKADYAIDDIKEIINITIKS